MITHVITGKTYFAAWSMDVKFEGNNVDRHVDITTSNHASPLGSTPPNPNLEALEWANWKKKKINAPAATQDLNTLPEQP